MPEQFFYIAFRITAPMLRAYAALTLDANPIHLDESFAAATSFGRPIAHGTLSLNAIWQACAAHGIDLTQAQVGIKFAAAVFVDDELRVQARLRERAPWAYEVQVLTQDGRTVVDALIEQLREPSALP